MTDMNKSIQDTEPDEKSTKPDTERYNVTGYNRRIRDPGRQEEDRRAIYIYCVLPAQYNMRYKNTAALTLKVSQKYRNCDTRSVSLTLAWQVTTESSAPLCD